MARNKTSFPMTIQQSDLADPQLSRLNRALQYIWSAIQGTITSLTGTLPITVSAGSQPVIGVNTATETAIGVSRPDGTSITIMNGVLSATGVYGTDDPRHWGAVGNGIANDSVAISLAIATGGLYLQPGVVFGYTWAGISAAIAAVSNGFTITGGGTLRLLSGGTPALTFTGSTLIRLLGFTVDGNNQTGSNAVIYLNGVSAVWLNSVFVLGAGSNPGLASTNDTYDARGCAGIVEHAGYL